MTYFLFFTLLLLIFFLLVFVRNEILSQQDDILKMKEELIKLEETIHTIKQPETVDDKKKWQGLMTAFAKKQDFISDRSRP